MKRIITLLACAALLTATFSCKPQEEKKLDKPVVTESMFSITVEGKSVHFLFTADDLSPYWKIKDPNGNESVYNKRDFTETYVLNGTYNGTLSAFGEGGESDPYAFSFVVGGSDPEVELSEEEKIITSKTWAIGSYGWYGEGWEALGNPTPKISEGVRLNFQADGSLVIDLGGTSVFHDDKGTVDNYTITGNEKWKYVEEGGLKYILFSDGGFPGMLAADDAVDGKYLIAELSEETFRLDYNQSDKAQMFSVSLVPYVPAREIDEEYVTEVLTSGKWKISRYGWWGEANDWEWYDDVTDTDYTDDVFTFTSDGKFLVDQAGTNFIYNDDLSDTQGKMEYTFSGNEKWSLTTESGKVYVVFSNNGFPGMLAGNDFYNSKCLVNKLNEKSFELSVHQSAKAQWMSVIFVPAE